MSRQAPAADALAEKTAATPPVCWLRAPVGFMAVSATTNSWPLEPQNTSDTFPRSAGCARRSIVPAAIVRRRVIKVVSGRTRTSGRPRAAVPTYPLGAATDNVMPASKLAGIRSVYRMALRPSRGVLAAHTRTLLIEIRVRQKKEQPTRKGTPSPGSVRFVLPADAGPWTKVTTTGPARRSDDLEQSHRHIPFDTTARGAAGGHLQGERPSAPPGYLATPAAGRIDRVRLGESVGEMCHARQSGYVWTVVSKKSSLAVPNGPIAGNIAARPDRPG